MNSTRRTFVRGLVAVVALAACSISTRSIAQAAASMLSLPAGGQLQPAAVWTPLGPRVPVSRLFAPTSGALLASAESGLLRSDDAGTTWRAIPLPPRQNGGAIEVDPADHQRIYADTNDGLQRSDDAGATWTTLLPTTSVIRRIAISPADPRVIYVAQGGTNTGDFWFHRSLDRGITWEQIDEQHNSSCVWGVPVLAPHLTDPTRLFRTAGCYAGRNQGDKLTESRDSATSWQQAFRPQMAFPKAVVGGGDSEPQRFYLAVNNDFRSGGSVVLTSTDDAASWSPILEHTGGGTMTGASQPSTTVGGLTYDPAMPGHVLVGLNRRRGATGAVEAASVCGSVDAGATWVTHGHDGLPEISDLVLGLDGRNLFAATAQGVWRLALD